MLATFDDPTLEPYFADAMRSLFTPRSIGEEGAMRREITAMRESGWALIDEEFTPGVCGLARAEMIDRAAVRWRWRCRGCVYTEAVKAEIRQRLPQVRAVLANAT